MSKPKIIKLNGKWTGIYQSKDWAWVKEFVSWRDAISGVMEMLTRWAVSE